MAEEKKFLDQAGVQYLWSKLSLEDYPNNQDLVMIINAIDETKLDKKTFDVFYKLYVEASKEDIENIINGGH